MKKLYSLAYISKNTIEGTTEQIQQEIKRILDVAHKNNPSLGVTGALLYSGGYFCQVIEGEEDALEELYENIQMDDRHGEVTVLHFEEIESRSFGEWSMALAGIEDHMRFDIEGILDSKDKIKMEETGKNLVNTLEQMISEHQKVL